MKYPAIIAMTILISGCSAFDKPDNKAPTWDHTHKNKKIFYKDNANCLALSGKGSQSPIYQNHYYNHYASYNPYYSTRTQGGFAAGLNSSFMNVYNAGTYSNQTRTRNKIYEQCMLGKGYFR